MNNLDLNTWLGLSAIAAVITTAGSLFALFLKEFLFARSFERWKQDQSLRQVYAKYRDPIALSARELASRLSEIVKHYPPVYLDASLMRTDPAAQSENTINDPYFQKNKLVSTVYRLCSLLAWLELYRQEVVFLDSGRHAHNRRLAKCVESIRADLADGQLNRADNWTEWGDVLLFREEQRAIGELLIASGGGKGLVMGYATFWALVTKEQNRWIRAALSFFLELDDTEPDFRRTRYRRLIVHLVDLIELLDPKRLPTALRQARNECDDAVAT